MHAAFIPYGMKDKVDWLLSELEHMKLNMTYRKDGKEQQVPVQCQIRHMPGGIVEFIFPREHMDAVLNTLKFGNKTETDYQIDREISIGGIIKLKPLDYIMKFLRYEPAPDFKKEYFIPIVAPYVSIIPIGIRHDGDLTEPKGMFFEGWSHEAI